jgi:hypothetical protein
MQYPPNIPPLPDDFMERIDPKLLGKFAIQTSNFSKHANKLNDLAELIFNGFYAKAVVLTVGDADDVRLETPPEVVVDIFLAHVVDFHRGRALIAMAEMENLLKDYRSLIRVDAVDDPPDVPVRRITGPQA